MFYLNDSNIIMRNREDGNISADSMKLIGMSVVK